MARAKQEGFNVDKERKLQASALQALWKVPVAQWHHLLMKADAGGQWTMSGPNVIKGRCPYHEDHTPSFVINFNKRICKCFGSCGKIVTDLISLYARCSHTSYASALTDLALQINLDEIIGSGVNELSEFNRIQEMKKHAAMAMHSVIEEYVRDRPDHLNYLKPALIYLVHGRHIPLDLICSLPVGIFAKPGHLRKYIPEEFHLLFEQYFAEVNDTGSMYWGCPCFHYNDLPGSISRFKLRKMSSDAFRLCQDQDLSEPDMSLDLIRSLAEKSFYVFKDPYINEMGVFGLHYYNRMIGASETNAYVTEGEFDALSVMVSQLKESRPDFMIFATGGNGCSGLSFLRELGIRTIWVVQDAPSKSGDGYATRLLKDPNNFIGDTLNKALIYRIFHWSPDMRGGDLDESVQLMGYDTVVDYLFTNRKSTFFNNYTWVVTQCDNEIAELKANRDNQLLQASDDPIRSENIRVESHKAIVDCVIRWFSCIHGESEKNMFVALYTQREDVQFTQFSEVRTTLYSTDTIEGAAKYLANALKEYIAFSYYDNTAMGMEFTIWSKRLHECTKMPTTDSKIDSTFSQFVGRDFSFWVRDLLNGSKLFKKPTNDPIADALRLQKTSLTILNYALKLLIPETRSAQEMIRVGQGIHYADLFDVGNTDYVYFVNGDKVFRGFFPGHSELEWECIDNNVDGRFFFDLKKQKRWSAVDDVSELYSGRQIDIQKIYTDLQAILNAWRFENHDLMLEYIPAWIMSLPIQCATNTVNMTYITGQSSSGKTSFARGILGGTQNTTTYEVPSVVETTWYTTDPTIAGIYQELHDSSIALVFDEAENRGNSQHTERVRDFCNMALSIPFGGAKVSRGGATASARVSYTLYMPVLMSSIYRTADPVFLSRVVTIYTEKINSLGSVGMYIFSHFTDEDISRIRKSITVCFLHRLPEICVLAKKMRKQLSEILKELNINDRCITTMLPALIVLELLGKDAVGVFRRMVDANRTLLDNVNSMDERSDLLNAVLYTPGIRTAFTDNSTDIVAAKDCILSGEIQTLNNSGAGIKLLKDKGWIVIIWRDVKHTLLRNTLFRYEDEASLRETASKTKYIIRDLTRADHRFIVNTLGRTDIKSPMQYSVISAEYILDKGAIEYIKNNEPDTVYTEDSKQHQEEQIPIEAYNDEDTHAPEKSDTQCLNIAGSETILGADFSL